MPNEPTIAYIFAFAGAVMLVLGIETARRLAPPPPVRSRYVSELGDPTRTPLLSVVVFKLAVTSGSLLVAVSELHSDPWPLRHAAAGLLIGVALVDLRRPRAHVLSVTAFFCVAPTFVLVRATTFGGPLTFTLSVSFVLYLVKMLEALHSYQSNASGRFWQRYYAALTDFSAESEHGHEVRQVEWPLVYLLAGLTAAPSIDWFLRGIG